MNICGHIIFILNRIEVANVVTMVSQTPKSASMGLQLTTLGTRSRKAVPKSFELPPEWYNFYHDKYVLSKATFAVVVPLTQGKTQCGCQDVKCFTKVNVIAIFTISMFTEYI